MEKWRVRDLPQESVKYLFIDGVNFRMRIKGSVEPVPVLVVIGVLESNHKLVLGLQYRDKESASCWREFFKDLKNRDCLAADKIRLGIMDGLRAVWKRFLKKNSANPRFKGVSSTTRERYNNDRPHWAIIPEKGGDPITPSEVYREGKRASLPRWQA